MNEVSNDWLRLVEKALVKMQQLPVLEENFPFPWENASRAIGSALQLADLSLSGSHTVWKAPEEIMQGMGEKLFIVAVEIAPIEGSVFFAMPDGDVAYLIAQTLVASEHKESFSNARLREGFYHFLFLKVLEALDHLKIFKGISFHFAPANALPQENAFCVDIQCSLPEKILQGRVICPQSFLTAFKAHQPLQKRSLLSEDITQNIEVSLRCEVGHTEISKEEWEKINVGDFIILDRHLYDPLEGKGSTTVMLGETPLMIARMKPEGMKILDFAYYTEEEIPSSKQPEGVSENHFTLTAEMGRIHLSLHKLLHLQPGMMLDLSMRPEQGVEITIGGQKVAKGELLKLGETVGLRILDIDR